MTRRDYVFISSAISQAQQHLRGAEQRAAARHIAHELALAFSNVNPAFDIERFMTDCGFSL